MIRNYDLRMWAGVCMFFIVIFGLIFIFSPIVYMWFDFGILKVMLSAFLSCSIFSTIIYSLFRYDKYLQGHQYHDQL